MMLIVANGSFGIVSTFRSFFKNRPKEVNAKLGALLLTHSLNLNVIL